MKAFWAAAAVVVLAVGAGGGARAQAPLWESTRAPFAMPQPARSGMVQVDDVELYYAVFGEGRPVILLHDGLGNSDHWGSQVGPLSQTYRVIVVDARGHGRSSRGTAPLGYGRMAEDVYQLMRKLRLKEAAVVGWGDGANVALELAMRHPKRVSELVLFGAAFSREGVAPDAASKPAFQSYASKALADRKRLAPGADVEAHLAEMAEMWGREPNYSAEQLMGVKIPATVVIAEYDETVRREHSEQLVGLLSDSQSLVMPGVSHFAPWQDPRTFNELVAAALNY